MNHPKEQFKNIVEFSLPWLVLAALLTYTYAKFFKHPYGFTFNPNGYLEYVFIEQPEPTLKVGDRLLQVGSLGWEEFRADLRRTFFADVKPGEVMPVRVQRAGQEIEIAWKLPGPNLGEQEEQLASEWFLAYIFWIVGTLAILVVRPRDDRWILLALFNFLTTIWLISGSGLSNYHLWYSALVLRMAIWLSVPVYLHLHWVFPRPLGKLSPLLIGTAYAIALILMVAQWFQLLPQGLYFLGFLIAILGSLILLVIHAIRQPDTRRDLRLLLIAVFLVAAPLIALAVTGILDNSSPLGGSLALVGFPLLPGAYLYAAYRRRLGGLEVRVNRLISFYAFLILLGLIGLPLLAITNRFINETPEETLVTIFFVGVLVTMLSIWGFPVFQNYVERRWLGIALASQNLSESYSDRIITSASLPSLLKLLEQDVFPSLLVRQYVFVQVSKASAKVLLSKNATIDQVHKETLTELLALFQTHNPLLFFEENRPFGWVRVVFPLRLDSDLIGAWLLGRRDPEDLYPQAELPILQSLANQTAIALSNVLQTERLRRLYEDDIERNEKSRHQLALDLHDSVLNQLAILRLNVDEAHVSQNFQRAYEEVTSRLREIVTDLRPPMLSYGLPFALEELADNLMQRSQDTVKVVANVQTTGETRYPENIERHIFRIVQEACENAIRHGSVAEIHIQAKLSPGNIWLLVEDDGIGFQMTGQTDLETLLENRHFGLAGMLERGMLIGAKVNIDSAPKAGTRVEISWSAPAPATSDEAPTLNL